jgi:hypothetical protein
MMNFLTWTGFPEGRHREPLATHHATIPHYLLQNLYTWLITGYWHRNCINEMNMRRYFLSFIGQ